MADATITFDPGAIHTPGNVTGGGPIREDEFQAVFKVTVYEAGCYAIRPTLRAYTRIPIVPDTDVGYVGGALIKCYCFAANEEQTFYVRGHGSPPADAEIPPVPGGRATRLRDLEGTWPKRDFPFDNLELYVRVEVLLCSRGDCRERNCGSFRTNDDDDQNVVGSAKSDRQKDAKIQGGDPAKEQLIDILKEGAKSGAGSIPMPKPK